MEIKNKDSWLYLYFFLLIINLYYLIDVIK
jgi:hypothetical protein